jgi:curved DNA-binding protein CbpA
MDLPKDYYHILKIPASATRDEIKKAYRKLAHEYHPDKNAGNAYAALQFADIKEAYEVLTDPSKKAFYLQQRWYHQSTGNKNYKQTNTPVTVLQQLLELDKYVSTIDIYRMDEQGIYKKVSALLNEGSVEMLNSVNDVSINTAIIETALNITSAIRSDLLKAVIQKLENINGFNFQSELAQKKSSAEKKQ